LSRQKELFKLLAKDPDLKALFFICSGLMFFMAGVEVFRKVVGT